MAPVRQVRYAVGFRASAHSYTRPQLSLLHRATQVTQDVSVGIAPDGATIDGLPNEAEKNWLSVAGLPGGSDDSSRLIHYSPNRIAVVRSSISTRASRTESLLLDKNVFLGDDGSHPVVDPDRDKPDGNLGGQDVWHDEGRV